MSHALCITEGTQIRKFMVFLQSCTVSLPVLQRSCSESSVPSIDACGVISVKREEDSDIDCQAEEIPIAISFPKIKCEQDEVSYVCMCSLLGAFCQCPAMPTAFHHLRISPFCPPKEFHCGERKFLSVLGLCEALLRLTGSEGRGRKSHCENWGVNPVIHVSVMLS